MSLKALTEEERRLIYRCLLATAEGDYFPEWEFHTLMGVSRDEMREVVRAWPDVDETKQVTGLSINNALNNLCGYPHGMESTVEEDVGATVEMVMLTLNRWRDSNK